MNQTWTQQAMEAARPVREAIFELPFVKELAAGTLPNEKFIFYLRQDAMYLANYSKVLASIASRLTDSSQVAAFLSFASDGIAVEKALHESYLSQAGGSAACQPSPSCMAYMNLLGAQSMAPVEVQAASVLPCFLIYLETGRHIASISTRNNPYEAWIDTYADSAFEKSCQIASDICNSLAANTSDEIRRAMTDVFVLASKMEWMFWDSAYNLEKWKI